MEGASSGIFDFRRKGAGGRIQPGAGSGIFRKYYCAENMVISVAGHFDTEQMYEWLCSYFEAIPEGERSDPGKAPVYTPVLWTREKDIETESSLPGL